MYSMDELLHLLHSDGADELRLHVGQPPIIVLDGEEQLVEGPAITAEDAQLFWQSVSTTRHRRTLREEGAVDFIHRFRGRTSFVVRATVEGACVAMEIH
jgi:Tfp pilus assembly pilus retraction ATPase PilT